MDIRMKRSEALNIIDKAYTQFVDDWLNLDISNEEEITSFKPLNERILSAIEQAGMLPPRCELQKLGTSDNAWEPEE